MCVKTRWRKRWQDQPGLQITGSITNFTFKSLKLVFFLLDTFLIVVTKCHREADGEAQEKRKDSFCLVVWEDAECQGENGCQSSRWTIMVILHLQTQNRERWTLALWSPLSFVVQASVPTHRSVLWIFRVGLLFSVNPSWRALLGKSRGACTR